MRRPRALVAVALTLVALALVFADCGGEDDEGTTTNSAPSEAPTGGASPPGLSALPPGIAECLADQGFEIEPSELHSVPQQVLQTCFSALHQGGGAP